MLSVLVLVMDLSGALGASVRSEARLQSPGTDGSDLAFELETAPLLELTLASRRSSMYLSYTPRLTLLDTSREAGHPYLLQELAGRFGFRSRNAGITLEGRGAYGDSNVARAAARPVAIDGMVDQPLELVPTSGVWPVVSSSTSMAADLSHRRWTFRSSLGYELGGGADREAREVLPYRYGPNAAVGLEYALRRSTRAVTLASASRVAFSSGAESELITLEQGFRHRWSSVSEAQVSVGVTRSDARPEDRVATRSELHPSGEVVWTRQTQGLHGQTSLRFGVRLSPVVNRLLGVVDERVEGSFAFRRDRGSFATTLLLGASQSVPMGSPTSTRLFAGELAQAYDVSKAFTVGAGLRSSWQRQEAAAEGFLQAGLFVSVTLRAPRVAF